MKRINRKVNIKRTEELRIYAYGSGVKLWELAKNVLHISYPYMSTRLRDGLTDEEIDDCIKYIDENCRRV